MPAAPGNRKDREGILKRHMPVAMAKHLRALFLGSLLASVVPASEAALLFTQPHNGSSGLYQSAVNGTDYDQMTWDSFRLTNTAAITEIRWRGGYLYGGAYSGKATNWTVAIYGDIANGYQPDIINPPLVSYTVAGSAGETNAGTFGGTAMYDYAFALPSPFQAASNQYYWVLIQANQTGIPEWGLALGASGNGGCFRRIANVGDFWFYRASGDTAFSLIGSDAPTVAIAASVTPAGAGTLLGAGNYPVGSLVSMRATPASGYGFVRWTQNGVQVSAASTYNFTAVSNRALVANFVPAYTMTTMSSPTYAGTVSGAGTFNSNAMVTVTATPASGFQFMYWADFGVPVSPLRSYTFPATADRHLVATFAFQPQTAVFDFDPGDPPVYLHGGMPGAQSNRGQSAAFTALNYSWSIQNTIYGWVSPLFSGNFLYPSTGGATLAIQFSPPVTNISLNFVTADLTTAGDVPTTVRVTAYTNALGTLPVGSATAQGSQWANGPYPDGTLTYGSPTPFDFAKIDFPPGQPFTVSYMMFVDNIVVQRQLPASTTVAIATAAFPDYAGTTTGDGLYTNGASVLVTATTNTGYAFVNWVEAGLPVSTARVYTFSATNARALFANFTPLNTISATASPANGGAVTGGAAYTNGANVTVTATPSNGFFFVNWTENGQPVSTTASFSFAAYADRAVVANFSPGSTISTTSSPGAGGTTSGGGGYANGATAAVVATPNVSYAFVSWKQGSTVVSTSATYSFTVASNRTLTAAFVKTYAIAALASPGGSGLTSGAGIYTNGASVTVRAAAGPGFAFTNWTDGATVVSTATNYTFTVTTNRTLTANFITAAATYTISLGAWPDFAGTVSGGGAYSSGATAVVTATPNLHFAFAEWTEGGAQVSTDAVYSFTVSASRSLEAHFTDTYPPPVAVGGTYYQMSGEPLSINVADLIYNDYDADGDPVSLFSIAAMTSNRLVLKTNATQVLIPTNWVPDSFIYTITDGNGGTAKGTATIQIITNLFGQVVSVDVTPPVGIWVGFSGVPWYYHAAQRATNVLFTGPLQAWPVQAGPDGLIYVWDDFTDLGYSPTQVFYRLLLNP